ncbi:hypothetical protein EDD85DRAFT_112385 [Armillaria nabsnona]|nr:hypothetical protein EDD85DRAFT_112385 [Armillaria nabsnona]
MRLRPGAMRQRTRPEQWSDAAFVAFRDAQDEARAREEQRGKTPPPDNHEDGYLSPAWDPHSDMPRGHFTSSSSVAVEQHWSLDPRLEGIAIRVYFDNNHEKNRDVIVTPELYEGRLQLRKKQQRSRVTVSPSRISPMHPNTRDYGRWVVIQGEHCGKYVRATQFKHLSKDILQWQLFVVVPCKKEVDTVTGEEILVNSDALCLVPESAESKKLNKSLSERRKGSRDA